MDNSQEMDVKTSLQSRLPKERAKERSQVAKGAKVARRVVKERRGLEVGGERPHHKKMVIYHIWFRRNAQHFKRFRMICLTTIPLL